MAPELLDGAIEFNSHSFKSIDVYACALVLWELVCRCNESNEVPLPQHTLPFEIELGSQPTIDTIRQQVLVNKMRPRFPEICNKHEVIT